MNKTLLLSLVILVLMPLAFAGDIGTVNQSMTLFSDVLTSPIYYPSTQANITIRNSTGSIVANNLSMAQLVPGLYAYNFTPNTTGQYYTITTFANSTTVLGSASSTFYVQAREVDNLILAVVVAICFLIAFCLYLSTDLMKKPQINIAEKGFFSTFTLADLGAGIVVFALCLVCALFAILSQATSNESYFGVITTLYKVSLYVFLTLGALYFIFYLIFKSVASTTLAIQKQRGIKK